MRDYTHEYGFSGSKKQWKDQLAKWEFRKRLNKEDAAYILYLIEQSNAQGITRRVFFNRAEKTIDDIRKYISKSDMIRTEEELGRFLDLENMSPYGTWEDLRLTAPLASPNPRFIDIVAETPSRMTWTELRVASTAISDVELMGSMPSIGPALDENVDVARPPLSNSPILWHLPVTVPKTPAIPEAQRPENGAEEVISQSILVASRLSEARRNGESQPHPSRMAPAQSPPDPDLLWQTIDTLAWAQVSYDVILLALEYFNEVVRLEIAPTRHGLWTGIIISLKLAHTLLNDHTLSSRFWGCLLQKHGISAVEGFRIERDLLAHPEFNAVPACANWDLRSYEANKAANSCVEKMDTALRFRGSNPNPLLVLQKKSGPGNLRDWEVYKEEICRLYLDEKLVLQDLMEIMRRRHGFVASERAFRTKLHLWGTKKNVPNFPGMGVLRGQIYSTQPKGRPRVVQ